MKIRKPKIHCHIDCILSQIIMLIQKYPINKNEYDYLNRSLPSLLNDELKLAKKRINEDYQSMTKYAFLSRLINRGISSVVEVDEVVESIIDLYIDFVDMNNIIEMNNIRTKLLEIISINYVLILPEL